MCYDVLCIPLLVIIEEVEVINLQKLVLDGEVAEGSKCSVQYKQQMWHGEIHSLHGKLKFAILLWNRG